MSSRRTVVVVIICLVVSLAAMLMSIEAYTTAKSTQSAQSLTATTISIGQKLNWKLGEVVDVQGNLYAYWGYYLEEGWGTLRIGKWQNGWMELAYGGIIRDPRINVTLSPYTLYVQEFGYRYLTATFFES